MPLCDPFAQRSILTLPGRGPQNRGAASTGVFLRANVIAAGWVPPHGRPRVVEEKCFLCAFSPSSSLGSISGSECFLSMVVAPLLQERLIAIPATFLSIYPWAPATLFCCG